MRLLLLALYRAALFAFPADFRRRFSSAMLEVFDLHRKDVGALRATAAIFETAAQGLQERSSRFFASIRSPSRGLMSNPVRSERRGVFAFLSGCFRDARFALRAFRRSPTFTVTALVILTVGIGASTAVFTVLDALMLRSLPFPDADRLVTVTETYQPENGPREFRSVSYPDFRDWRDHANAFTDLGIQDNQNVSLASPEGEPVLVGAEFVSPSFFRMLGIRPVVGRVLEDDDDVRRNLVAVISHDLWETRYGGDRSIVGTLLHVNDRAVSVVGVAQPGFGGVYGGASIWIPFLAEGDFIQGRSFERVQRRGLRGFGVFGRLAPSATLSEAQRQIDVVSGDLHASGVLPLSRGALVEEFAEANLGDARDLVTVLAVGVGLVLLIACANVANLLLARQLGRTKEMALRRAIGADRATLIRQLLVESIVLGGIGGVGGATLAVWFVDIVGATIVDSVPTYIVPAVNAKALLFAISISLVTGVIFGLVPALSSRRATIGGALRSSPRSDAAGGGGFGIRRVLVIGQVAIAIPLLVGSGLMIRSIANTLAIDTGFDPSGVAIASVTLPPARYDASARSNFIGQLQVNLRQFAGVDAATVASDLPLNAGYSASDVDLSDSRYAGQGYRVYVHRIGTRFFETLGIPVLEGREFVETDRAETRSVIVISKQMADRFWPGTSPLGQMIDSAEVVGVVANASYRSLLPDQEQFPNDPDVFFPIVRNAPANLQVAIRGLRDPVELTEIVRSEIHALDPTLPIFGVTTLSDLMDDQVGASRAATQQLGAFAIIALLLAVGGLFGVMAYSVGRQAGEIGLRMALGATSRRILVVFLGRAMGLVLAGVLIGVTFSIAVVRVLDSQLYGVASNDWTTYSAAGGLFLIVGLAACLMPALRATRIDPLLALRSE